MLVARIPFPFPGKRRHGPHMLYRGKEQPFTVLPPARGWSHQAGRRAADLEFEERRFAGIAGIRNSTIQASCAALWRHRNRGAVPQQENSKC